MNKSNKSTLIVIILSAFSIFSVALYAYRMNTITLHVVRHGQTDWNVMNIVQGHTDIPLNEIGKKQAARVGKYFTGKKLDVVYSSDLSRAYETAQGIAQITGAKVISDKRLRERNFGTLQGGPRDIAIPIYSNPHPDPKYNLESVDDHLNRILDFLATNTRSDTKEMYIVTHGGSIRRLLSHANHPVPIKTVNASVSTFEYNRFTKELTFVEYRQP